MVTRYNKKKINIKLEGRKTELKMQIPNLVANSVHKFREVFRSVTPARTNFFEYLENNAQLSALQQML